MLLGVASQNRTFSPKKLVHQTPLKYEKELFDQVNKLKTSFFGVSNTHLISLSLRSVSVPATFFF